LRAQQLRRVVRVQRVRPERAAREEARGAALARVLDGEWKLVLRHALREHDPRHRQHLRDLATARHDVALPRRLALVERRPRRPELARRLGDLAIITHDRLEHRHHAVPRCERDEALAHLDPLSASLVVAPDDEELQCHDAVRHLVDLVETRVLDDPAALLLQQVDGHDQPARHERPHVLDEMRLDEKT
jgi:hypothetical protein